MKTRTLTLLVGVVAALALYGCGSGYISEFPTTVEGDGCQPGEIVEVHWGTTIGGNSGTSNVGKSDFTRIDTTGGLEENIICVGLDVAVNKVDLVSMDGNVPRLVDSIGDPIDNPEFLPSGTPCADANRCCHYNKVKVNDPETGTWLGSFTINVDCKVACDEVASDTLMKMPLTVYEAFTSELETDTPTLISVRKDDKSVAEGYVYELESLAFAYEEEVGAPGVRVYNHEEGEFEFIEIADFTEELYPGIGFTSDEILAWEAYNKTGNGDKFAYTVVGLNNQSSETGIAYGEIIVPIEAEVALGSLSIDGLDIVRTDVMESLVQSCQSRDPSKCDMDNFLNMTLPIP